MPLQTIPATLQEALLARLDRLATARQIAQLGATLGREFSYELLQALAPISEPDLQAALAKLVEAEILYQRGVGPQTHYFFKHALIQDTAYQSLLKSTRQQHHQQIARMLEEQFTETKEHQPELLAHHYTEGNLIERAIPCWQQAGQIATQRSAYVEAVAHLTRGLELLKALPDTPARAQQELALQLALGASRVATEGFAAVEVEKTYTRALELCQQVGETPQLFPVLEGLSAFYAIRAELQTARRLAEQLLSIAQSAQDPGLLLEAFHESGFNRLYSGELSSAWTLLKQGVALYDPQQHHSLAFLYVGHDPGVCCLANEAVSLWLLGYPDQALQKVRKAVTLDREIAHPFSLALALGYLGWSYQFCRNKQEVVEQADTIVTLSTEQMFPYWLPGGRCYEAGHLPSKAITSKESRRYSRDSLTIVSQGQSCSNHIILLCWPRRMGRKDRPKKGLPCWPKRWLIWRKLESVGTRQSCIGWLGSCRSEWENGRRGEREKKKKSPIRPFTHSPILLQRNVSRRPLKSPANSRPSPGNSVQQQAWRACGRVKVSSPQPATR